MIIFILAIMMVESYARKQKQIIIASSIKKFGKGRGTELLYEAGQGIGVGAVIGGGCLGGCCGACCGAGCVIMEKGFSEQLSSMAGGPVLVGSVVGGIAGGAVGAVYKSPSIIQGILTVPLELPFQVGNGMKNTYKSLRGYYKRKPLRIASEPLRE